MPTIASYCYLDKAEWDRRIAALDRLAAQCALCPRRCGVNRLTGEKGFCRAANRMRISSVFPHHGEEPPISGTGGSGTVFFSHCTLRCVFCQNYQISHEEQGEEYSEARLAQAMMGLQEKGCHNINLVTPTHFLPWIVRSLKQAAGLGLTVPVVCNCGGYELAATIALLKDIVDIYLPDMKYGRNAEAQELSRATDYVEVNQSVVREMFRQAGPLTLDKRGIAIRGVCIRHLVLPGAKAGSDEVADFLVRTFDPNDVTVSLMAQYFPAHRAREFCGLNRRVLPQEYAPVRELFRKAGFGGFFQELENIDGAFAIDFAKRKSEPLTGKP